MCTGLGGGGGGSQRLGNDRTPRPRRTRLRQGVGRVLLSPEQARHPSPPLRPVLSNRALRPLLTVFSWLYE